MVMIEQMPATVAIDIRIHYLWARKTYLHLQRSHWNQQKLDAKRKQYDERITKLVTIWNERIPNANNS